MMILKEEDFLLQFTRRTLENYKKVKETPDIYEVTLLINSAVGLLFIPKEQNEEQSPKKSFHYSPSKQLLSNLQNGISLNTYTNLGQNEDFSEIMRHIRNAIAHGRFDFQSEKQPNDFLPAIVHSVEFRDKYKGQEFKITLSIKLFEAFMIEIADTILKSQK